MKPDSSEPSPIEKSNEFLNREVERLELERDTLSRELQQIQHGYAWKLIDGYRHWLARHRDNRAVQLYEKLAIWMLKRAVGIDEPDPAKRYVLWMDAHNRSAEYIERASTTAKAFPYRPLIGVTLSIDGAPSEKLIASAIESVRAQLYDNWHLCIVSEENVDPPVAAMLARYAANDSCITIAARHDSIPAEFVTFLDPWDQLAPDAFYEVIKRLNRNPHDDLFYFDEDQIDSVGRRTRPFFKPDWSPELLLSMNYFGGCFVVRKSLADEAGGFLPDRTYQLALHASERTDRIVHIPEVLYHRHTEAPSTANQSDRHSARAIEAAISRRGESGKVDIVGPGLFAVRYELREEPLISILIPTRDHADLLRRCIESIEHNTDYKNYEILVLDNDSVEPATQDYFKSLNGKVQVHRFPGRFNFSAINNFGVTKARGEVLLFLNNDTEVIQPGWMRAMLEQAQRPAIGAVGAKLLFGDGRIQHAGIVLGLWGMVGHAFRLTRADAHPYFGLADVIRDCSAVTAACMMMRRAVFEEAGGFDEALAVEFNDVDLCLRLRARGYRIVFTPRALLHHHESATRRHGHVEADQAVFVQRWDSHLKGGDPYYNRHLTLTREDWAIAI